MNQQLFYEKDELTIYYFVNMSIQSERIKLSVRKGVWLSKPVRCVSIILHKILVNQNFFVRNCNRKN